MSGKNNNPNNELKPTYLLHVWQLQGGGLSFELITDKNINQCKRWWEYRLVITGRAAVVHCYFSDYDIRDNDLVTLATLFMKGRYKMHVVNLDKLEVTTTDGVNRIHPR